MLRAATSEPFSKWLARPRRQAAEAVTAGVTLATEGLKTELRQAIAAAGLGDRLGNAIGSAVYPKGQSSLGAAGSVFARGASADRVLDAFANGAVIRAQTGGFLAIPTAAAGKYGDGRKKITPGMWERAHGQRLRFVYRRGAPSLLVADGMTQAKNQRGFKRATERRLASGRGLASVVMFILVPLVRLPRKFDAEQISSRWALRIPDLIEQSLPAET